MMRGILGRCLNWKVVAGLGVVAVGVFVVAPKLALAALPVLLVLACPLSCLFMMRGMSGTNSGESAAQDSACRTPGMRRDEALGEAEEHGEPRAVPLSRDEQLALLTDQLAQIQAQQDALACEIAALEAPTPSAVSEAEAVARAADERVQESL